MEQQTISGPFTFEGVGIHSGARARVTVRPAAPGSGRSFHVAGVTIPAHVRCVVDTKRCTTLGIDGTRVGTVEHLLSALAGCGIDNCTIDVEGPEIPILDGSALPIVAAIHNAGIERQRTEARSVRLARAVSTEVGASAMRAERSNAFELHISTDFDEWPEGAATLELRGEDGVPTGYAESVAPARTFAFRAEVEMLIAAGLAKGGSLDNALIVSPPDTFSSPLRVPLEWCAHKMLDVIGDLALLNARPIVAIHARRPGHRINVALAQAIFAQCGDSTDQER
jgi:UDP-3-O-[3-hydroxymyristoyl] N-acetylglucosamine deacetylase